MPLSRCRNYGPLRYQMNLSITLSLHPNGPNIPTRPTCPYFRTDNSSRGGLTVFVAAAPIKPLQPLSQSTPMTRPSRLVAEPNIPVQQLLSIRRPVLSGSTPCPYRPLPMPALSTYQMETPAEGSFVTRQTSSDNGHPLVRLLWGLLTSTTGPVSRPTYLRTQRRIGHEPG